jgi:hypothetical protein
MLCWTPQLVAFATSFMTVGVAELFAATICLRIVPISDSAVAILLVYGLALAIGLCGTILSLIDRSMFLITTCLCRNSHMDREKFAEEVAQLERVHQSYPFSSAAGCVGATVAVLTYLPILAAIHGADRLLQSMEF